MNAQLLWIIAVVLVIAGIVMIFRPARRMRSMLKAETVLKEEPAG